MSATFTLPKVIKWSESIEFSRIEKTLTGRSHCGKIMVESEWIGGTFHGRCFSFHKWYH